ncbi:MAG: permease [Acidobacteria bacterium]|nr:MAG: permease [Acidobacteriota bacterium]
MLEAYSSVPSQPQTVAHLDRRSRAVFINRTYSHLFGAMILFTAIEVVLFKTGLAATLTRAMLGVSWLLVLGGFLVVSWLASRVAASARSLGAQYAALVAFVAAEALIFVPMLYLAEWQAPGVIQSAALVTMLGFGGLTVVAFATGKDFSFMGSTLGWMGVVVLVGIAAAVIFGFNFGTWFSVGMIAFAGAAILYDTSNVLHHYPEDRYVAASLALFASVALMFWYVLRLFMSRD